MDRKEAIKRLKQNKAAAEFYAGMVQITNAIENTLKDIEAFNIAIEALSAKPTDLISRADAVDAIKEDIRFYEEMTKDQQEEIDEGFICGMHRAKTRIREFPSADRPSGEWSVEEVAELLVDLFGDKCACNYNGIDEWLPQSCKYADTECPDPKEKHGCWMQFLKNRGAKMGGE